VTSVALVLGDVQVGEIYRHPSPGGERISFRYTDAWLASPARFALDPELHLDARVSSPARGGSFGALTDCAPDRWGRQLVQRRERRTAQAEGRAVCSLSELDYVLGVSDRSRLGALRFVVDGVAVAPGDEVPPLVLAFSDRREKDHRKTLFVDGRAGSALHVLVAPPEPPDAYIMPFMAKNVFLPIHIVGY